MQTFPQQFEFNDYRIESLPNDDSKIRITHKSGEGGEFDASEFGKALDAFFFTNF